MINLIHRCMTKSELSHKKWDNHLALFHLKEFVNGKEVYLNGKPLKWYHIFKKGDLIEVIDRPQMLLSVLFTSLSIAIAGISASTALIVAGLIGVVTSAVSSAIAGNRGVSTTQHKEYSSASQPELRGASNDISNDIVPVTFGTVQQTPSYAQTPFRLVQDGTGKNKYHQYFIPNYNNTTYSDYKLGETPITNYLDTYYSINTASGSDTFIGYDNCKALSIDEELSFDKDAGVNKFWSILGNSTNSARVTSEPVSISLYYTADNVDNFDITKFSNKTYTVELTYYSSGTPTTQTRSFTVSSSNIVISDGRLELTQNKSVSFSITFPAATSILLGNPYRLKISSDTDTRNNSYEILHGLNATLEFASITIGSYSELFNVETDITKYAIIPSEVIQTSPPDTTEIDVIVSFPQGLYKIKASDGSRLTRTAPIEIKYKAIDSQTWLDLDSATSIYIRDINNDKQPLSSSSTTYSNGIFTLHTPDDLNVADQLFFRPIGFELPAGQYDVRVRCADFKDKTNYDVGTPYCSEIQFRCTGDVVNPIVLPKTNQIAFEVTAYKNLSGTLKKFNYMAQTAIPTFDNNTWDEPQIVGSTAWNTATFGNNLFVVAGYNGYIVTSTDGITWNTPIQNGSNLWNDALYNSEFVIVGNNGYIATSTDGSSWNSLQHSSSYNWYGVTYANNTLVVLSNNGYIITYASSLWSDPVQISDNNHNWYKITYGNNLFVAVGYHTTGSSTGSGSIITSSDGVIWSTPIDVDTQALYGIAYGNGVFVAVSINGNVTTSTDGVTWTTPRSITNQLYNIKFLNNKFVAVGSNSNILTSTDGVTWETEQAGTNNLWYGLAYGNNNYVVAGMNLNSTGYIATKQTHKYTVSSNPALVIYYLLTDNKVNPRAEKLSHIDIDSLTEYYNFCEAEGYKADGIVSEACKIGEVVNQILQNTQTAMIPLYNGKHTFVTDKADKIPVGLFNQHNSWNFKWMPNVGRQVEAIRASFVENDDWTQDELTLYWYDGAVHDTPKEGTSDLDYEMIKKEYKYVSDRASVRKIAAYELETIQTKRNQFEFDVNLEALNMMLLDRIYISNTANMQNESTGLIKSLVRDANNNLIGFKLYAAVDIPENAKMIVRSLDYVNEKPVITIFDVLNSGLSDIAEISPLHITYDYPVKGAGDITGIHDTWHYDGDLFTIGQDTIYDCTVTDIKYNDDGTATITCRDYGFNNSST